MNHGEQPWPDLKSAGLLARRTSMLPMLRPKCVFPELTASDILAALRSPIWPEKLSQPLHAVVRHGEKVCLVVSDQTRKTASDLVLPVLLKEFRDHGCNLEDWFILFATGIHRPPNAAEAAAILGNCVIEAFQNRIFIHDPDSPNALVTVGSTRRGFQVRINRRAMAADRRILVGGVVYHYHAGFGGGRKSLVPGLAARDTIAFNHGLTLDPDKDRLHPGAAPGRLDGNPVAEEMLEAARLCGADAIVNTVLAPGGTLVGVFAGDIDMAHRAACARAAEALSAPLAEPADLVVASAGAAQNWIQSHKALYNAHCAIRRGGQIVLLAPCPEGIGDEGFLQWVCKPTIREIYQGLRNTPDVLGQTALSTRIKGRCTVLVTRMPEIEAGKLGMALAPDPEAAIRLALSRLQISNERRPTCLLMPNAAALLPIRDSAAR